jgi:hypothetical protein
MISNYQINGAYRTPEKFFAERLAELLFRRTIDSHRVRLNNPKASLEEVKYVLADFAHKKIKHFDKTVKPVVEEAQAFLKNDKTLKYDKIGQAYYGDLLDKAKYDDYLPLFYATVVVLKGNQDYFQKLCDAIESEISRLIAIPQPVLVHEYIHMDQHVEYLATELVNIGYSKNYLSKKIVSSFEQRKAMSFQDAFDELKALGTRPQESFDVIFRLVKKPSGGANIDLHDPQVLQMGDIPALEALNSRASQFFARTGPRYSYLKITQSGNDFFSVVEKAKKILLPKMDLLHMGFPDAKFDYEKSCLVIGANNPDQATSQPIRFISDGYYRNHQEVYDGLQQNIHTLTANFLIQKETIQKIVSAVRHLRLGSEADEMEQIFINYWIGLEYIFSNYDIGESTINRLKEYFVNAHALTYIKRNLAEFFRDIKRLGLDHTIANYNPNLQFLKDQATYDFIMTTYSGTHPLLALRAYYYKRLLHDPAKLKETIKTHRIHLDRHLTRCYRVRNEIVHDAAIHLNIEAITGHLKYYLTFIINDIIAFLRNNPMDLNLSGHISIEDYFIYQDLRIKGLEKTGFALHQLLDEISVTEIFT